MGTLQSEFQPRGLPRWTLLAAIPVVLALGFVAGMAIATYAPGQAALTVQQGAGTGAAKGSVPPTTGGTTAQADSSWSIPPKNQPAFDGGPALPDTSDTPAANHGLPGNATPYTGPVETALEARKALVSDFSVYNAGGVSFYVEYQQMKYATGNALVGLLSVSDYPAWERAVRDNPDRLTQWLSAAAARAQGAASREGFHLAWAVVDVLRDRPDGFAANEITPLDGRDMRSFLVVRPLASTVDHTKTEISLRPLASLQAAAHQQPVTSTEPWAAYGPVLRFDGSDIYVPSRAVGARPLK